MEAWLNMYQEKIIDISTGEETLRPYTDAEIAEVEADIKATKAEMKNAAAAQSQKDAERQAILDKLGITADEAAALLG
jgi:hypothetical protein